MEVQPIEQLKEPKPQTVIESQAEKNLWNAQRATRARIENLKKAREALKIKNASYSLQKIEPVELEDLDARPVTVETIDSVEDTNYTSTIVATMGNILYTFGATIGSVLLLALVTSASEHLTLAINTRLKPSVDNVIQEEEVEIKKDIYCNQSIFK